METWRGCYQLSQAGMWLSWDPEQARLLLGPRHLVEQHPLLVAWARTQKSALLRTIETVLVQQNIDQPGAPIPKLMAEVCPACQHPWWTMAPPKRLMMHSLSDGATPCPGAIEAQEDVANQVMRAFIAERCIQREGAVLTWMALRGAITGWAVEKAVLLPPRQYLLNWMDAEYTCESISATYASWRGLTFSLREWLGDDDAGGPASLPKRRRVVAP